MSFRHALIAAVSLAALQSCATQTAPPALTAADLLTVPYAAPAAQPFDVDAFFAALPAGVTAAYENAAFDAASGAMVVDGLSFSLEAAPVKLRVAQAKIWNGDAASMDAVFSGAATAPAKQRLFDRMALEGVWLDGAQWDGGAQNLSFNIDKLVFAGLSARSATLPENAEAPEDAGFIRMAAALMSSFAYDGAAFSNFSVKAYNNQGAMASLEVGEGFERGYDGGRLDYAQARNMRYVVTSADEIVASIGDIFNGDDADPLDDKILQPHARDALKTAAKNPLAVLASAYDGIDVVQETLSYETHGFDVSGGLEWLARWELPPITETDLIDLGASTTLGFKESWNGVPVQAMERMEVGAYDFYWLVPANLQGRYDGWSFAVGAMMDLFMSETGAGMTPEAGAQEFLKFRSAISSLGLDTVDTNGDFSWNWNGENGVLNAGANGEVVSLYSDAVSVGLDGPSLAEWAAFGPDAFGENAAFLNEVALTGFSYSITDVSLLDKLFALAAEETGGTAADLRQSAPAMIRMSAAQAAQVDPRIAQYAEALASFIEQGGTIEINLQPAAPVPLSVFQSQDMTPPELLDMLNLTIVHTP